MFVVGDQVIIRKVSTDPTKSWVYAMNVYDGKTAHIRKYAGSDQGNHYYTLDIDNELFYWLDAFLNPVVPSPVSTPSTTKSSSDGCRCSKCGDFITYANPSSTFVCYSCRRS
jgi:hypothetical protein